MDQQNKSTDSQSSGSWSPGNILLVFLVSILLSAVLYEFAPLLAAVAGVVGAVWLVMKSEDAKGKWGRMAFFCSLFGFPISALIIGGATMLLLSAPAWLLAQIGFINIK